MAPKVLSSNLNREIKPEQDKHIWLKVTDQETSISKYTAKIDGKWALMEYNLKKNKLLYNLKDMTLKKGKHLFELELQALLETKQNTRYPFISINHTNEVFSTLSIFVILFFVVGAKPLRGQTINLKGVVLNEKNKPIKDVNIFLNGKAQSATDQLGTLIYL